MARQTLEETETGCGRQRQRERDGRGTEGAREQRGKDGAAPRPSEWQRHGKPRHRAPRGKWTESRVQSRRLWARQWGEGRLHGRAGRGVRRGEGPSPPPSPGRRRRRPSSRVTKLPQDSRASHWRGCSQSEGSAAVLGQEARRRAHLPPTPSEARGHTIAIARTHTLSQGRAASPPHARTITVTRTQTCTHPEHAETHGIAGAHRISLVRHSPRTYTSTARTHNHNDTP